LTNEKYSALFNLVADLDDENIWSYEQALAMEGENFRENYLGFDFKDRSIKENLPEVSTEDKYVFEEETINCGLDVEAYNRLDQVGQKKPETWILSINLIKEAIANQKYLSFKYPEEDYLSLILARGIVKEDHVITFYGDVPYTDDRITYKVDLVQDLKMLDSYIIKEAENLDSAKAYELLNEVFLEGNLVRVKYYTAGSGTTQWRVLQGLTFQYF